MSFHPGFVTNILSSPIGGFFFNRRQERRDRRDFRRFRREQIDPFNQDLQIQKHRAWSGLGWAPCVKCIKPTVRETVKPRSPDRAAHHRIPFTLVRLGYLGLNTGTIIHCHRMPRDHSLTRSLETSRAVRSTNTASSAVRKRLRSNRHHEKSTHIRRESGCR